MTPKESIEMEPKEVEALMEEFRDLINPIGLTNLLFDMSKFKLVKMATAIWLALFSEDGLVNQLNEANKEIEKLKNKKRRK